MKPQGYSRARAQEIETGITETTSIENTGTENVEPENTGIGGLHVEIELNGQKPDIIVIMNESFADLSILGEFETDQPYLEHFQELQGSAVSGYTSVPAFFPSGVMAYQNYVKNGTFNLKNVYQYFDFDAAYYGEDWISQDMTRGWISVSGNYEDLIYRYEEAKAENENVFLFNVTIQNHGGYATADYESTVHITDLEGTYPQAEQYLSLIRESDFAFKELTDYFSQQENPV